MDNQHLPGIFNFINEVKKPYDLDKQIEYVSAFISVLEKDMEHFPSRTKQDKEIKIMFEKMLEMEKAIQENLLALRQLTVLTADYLLNHKQEEVDNG